MSTRNHFDEIRLKEYNPNSRYWLAIDEKYISTIRSLAPVDTSFMSIPSFRQCVGTKRLWGASLGWSLADDLEVGLHTRKSFMDIAVLSRAVLVLEDFIYDENLTNISSNKIILEWIYNIELILEKKYIDIGEDFKQHKELRSQSKYASDRRCLGLPRDSIYKLSINKCLIFFNPYRLEIARTYSLYNDRIKFLEAFFFMCQLLDDFQDLQSDIEKPINHNIFLKSRTKNKQKLIVEYRLHWLPNLLSVIKLNIQRGEFKSGFLDSQVLGHYYNSAMNYFNYIISKYDLPSRYSSLKKDHKFENWKFDPILNIGKDVDKNIEPLIRPELMQTHSIGVSNIDKV